MVRAITIWAINEQEPSRGAWCNPQSMSVHMSPHVSVQLSDIQLVIAESGMLTLKEMVRWTMDYIGHDYIGHDYIYRP